MAEYDATRFEAYLTAIQPHFTVAWIQLLNFFDLGEM